MDGWGVVFKEELLLDTADRVEKIHTSHGENTPTTKLIVLDYTVIATAISVRIRRTRFLVS